MQPFKKVKIEFSPSNIDEYERVFRLEHDIAMGYVSPLVPRVPSLIDVMNSLYPVPSPIHEPFRRWIEHNQLARFDCFDEPSWLCTCYKCITFQLHADHDTSFYERIKDEQERLNLVTDVRGNVPAINPPSPPNERLELLADIALHNARNVGPPQQPIWEPVTATVTNVCHFFTSLNLEEPMAPSTPKLTTISFRSDSDNGKEKAQQAWIRRQQMTPTTLKF